MIDRRTYLAGCILCSEWFHPTNEDHSKNVVKSVDCIIAELDRTAPDRHLEAASRIEQWAEEDKDLPEGCSHAFQGLRCLKCGASK